MCDSAPISGFNLEGDPHGSELQPALGKFARFPVGQQDPEMDLWEPPFERWLKLADVLLGNVTPARPSAPRKN